MKSISATFLVICTLFSCNFLQAQGNKANKAFSDVEIEPVYRDTISIRALEVLDDDIFFAGSEGKFGHFKIERNQKLKDGRVIPVIYKTIANEVIKNKEKSPEFRSVASTDDAFFFLSVDNPALLYRYDRDNYKIDLVYKEEADGVFYDSMAFINNNEGIAMGDPTDSCLSIIITRNGGKTWKKVSCENLPETALGEAAFAASNSNIAIEGNNIWLISGGTKSRIFHSPDRGTTWKVFETPIVQGKPTTGAYSIDFYDEDNGFIIGGDYTDPTNNAKNKAFTTDGGETWKLIVDGSGPGYKSSIKYVPNSEAKQLVAVGNTGISYSADGGKTWKKLTDEGFYTIEFVDENTAYASGNGKIAKLTFKQKRN